jgi:perosamine synthetase
MSVRETLAIEGGTPVRSRVLPYARQSVGPDDVDAVISVLTSDWLTTGPAVARFEEEFAAIVQAPEAVAVSSGTAALHAAMFAVGAQQGDEVIVPAMTFAASANAAVHQGATPVFVDILPETLLVDPGQVEARLRSNTRAIVAVDYAGHPCDYEALASVAAPAGVSIVADASHALGATSRGIPVGSIADLSTFSFHPVKHVTTGEGGMVATGDPSLAARMRRFRNHGIDGDHRDREEKGSWYYEMVDLGYNYRLTDFQCALGMVQLRHLKASVARRQEIAARYDAAFAQLAPVQPLSVHADVSHAYHLYVIQLALEQLRVDRGTIFSALRAEGIGVNVHYVPVHLHPYYRRRYGTGPGMCPVAEAAYERILSLPMFPSMSGDDVDDVIVAVEKVIEAFAA